MLDLELDPNHISVSSDAGVEQATEEMLNLLQDIQHSQPLDIPESNQKENNEAQIPVESESSYGNDSNKENHCEIQIE